MVPQQQRRRRRRAAIPRASERRLVVARGIGGFGFTIAGQRPCVVSAVAAGGPAERAGLRAGDALLAVDGASVARAPHASVARLVAGAPGAISLSVSPRDSPPTDTEDTEPDERSRTRRRHPPPRRRPQPLMHHPACHAAPSTSGVNEILQNLSRAQLTPNQVARLECRAVVGYLGTIDTPQAATNTAPGNVRNAVRKLRQERRTSTPVLLSVLPNSLLLRRPSGQVLAQYQRERIIYAGCGSEVDRRYFGLVTSAETAEADASHSCHVFAVDPRMAEHEAHITRAREFQIVCTSDPVAERCLEFPPSAEYVVGVIRGMYSLPAEECASPNLQQISKLAIKGDSPALGNFARCNAVFRPRDRRVCPHDDVRQDGQDFVANSPQPSNHSEITTTSSNSDSGIGFHNDGRNIAERILVVDFAAVQPPPNRFRPDMPRRPMGLVGCCSFDADGSFLSNTTPVVDGFGGQGRPLNLDDVILNANDMQTVRHVSPRKEDDNYNYNNVYGNIPSSSRYQNGVVYDQVYTENEGHHYEFIPPQLDMDLEIDHVAETFNSVEIYEESRSRHPPDWQSNESVENVTVISGGTSKASMDSVSMYSSRSHEEARPMLRRHMQASLDDMLVLAMRDQPKENDDDNFVHPGSVKCKVRKSMKPLNLLSKTKNMLTGKDRERKEARRRAISASAGDVTAAEPVTPDGLAGAASEPDLRDTQSEQSSPFRRWTTGSGAGSSYRHHDHRNMYNKQMSEGSSPVSSSGCSSNVTRWALGLEHLLADPAGAAAFAHFLAKEFAAENIRFWWSCEQYRTAEALTRTRLAVEIWERHLAPGADEPVNVDAEARRLTRSRLDLHPPPADLFAQAQKQIFNVMKFDSYQRFRQSSTHAECARAELCGLPPPYAAPRAPDPPTNNNNLKKSVSNASERRRSGGASLLARLRPASRERQQQSVTDVVKSSQPTSPALCRVMLPDGATSVVNVSDGTLTVGHLVDKLLQKRNLLCNTYDVVWKDPLQGEPAIIDLQSPSSILGGREAIVERRAVVRLELSGGGAAGGGRCVVVRCGGGRALDHVLRRVALRYNLARVTAAKDHLPLSHDTLMQELDGCVLQVSEIENSQRSHRAGPHERDVDAESLRLQDERDLDTQSNSTGSSRSAGVGTGPGAGAGARVRAALRPGAALHHHPPADFLDNLRETQRARLGKDPPPSPSPCSVPAPASCPSTPRTPPPLPPKPALRAPTVV